MAKEEQKKQDNVSRKAPRKVFKGPLLTMMMVAAVVVLGYKLWENPKLWYQMKDALLSSSSKEDVYQPQIDLLQENLSAMQKQLSAVARKVENPDFSAMEKRIDTIEQINVNTIKSKADVETVLGLIGRMDNTEGRLNDLAKVSDEGALILTAAMLVKDAGQRGGTFVYEAEVLSELAAGNHKIAKEVARINEISEAGVPSTDELQREFAAVYLAKYPEAPVEEVFEGENWKDRIYHQLHKVVQIKKADEVKPVTKAELSEEDRAWGVIRDYVADGDIYRAVAIIKKPLNAKMAEDKNLAEWLKKAEMYKDFNDSVSRISANALAIMKVKFLRSEK